MFKIAVQKLDETTFEVTVESGTTTTHTVTADPRYVAELAGSSEAAETLVRRSFEFLLEREPNTGILKRFDLRVIGTYFPEYERVLRGTPSAN